jgi:riboflavin biosynthesis pyrimidine reductase
MVSLERIGLSPSSWEAVVDTWASSAPPGPAAEVAICKAFDSAPWIRILSSTSCVEPTAGMGVAAAHDAAGNRDLLVLAAEVVNQCLGAGLVDEILIHLVPELLGGGIRLFDTPQLRASLPDP